MAWFNPSTWFFTSPRDPPGTPTRPTPSRGILGLIRDLFTGWLGPRQSKGTDAEEWLEREKAHSGPAGVVLPAFLPYYDNLTAETGQMRLAYRRMLADPNVKAALLSKIFGVASLELKVQPADKKDPESRHIAEFVEWSLNKRLTGGISGLVWSVLSGGLIDGLSVSEKVWAPQNKGKHAGSVVLSRLAPKDVGNDLVLQTDSFRRIVSLLGLRYNGGLEFSPANFLIWRNLVLFESPVGMSDLRAVYARWWVLDTAWKLRAIGLNKHATPLLKGTYKTASQKQALEETLGLSRSRWWLSLPEGVQIEVLDMAGSEADIFKAAIDDLVEQIFLGITGATLQSLTGGAGEQRGSSKVHKGTADLFKWWLSSQIHSLLNDQETGLIIDLVDLNFVVSEYPTATLSAVDVEELAAELQIDAGLNALGLDLSKEETYERYGRTPPSPNNPDDILKGKADSAATPAVPSAFGGTPGERFSEFSSPRSGTGPSPAVRAAAWLLEARARQTQRRDKNGKAHSNGRR